jgi:hypothetical protein
VSGEGCVWKAPMNGGGVAVGEHTRRHVPIRHPRTMRWGKDEMSLEMSILPLTTSRTTSMPPFLSSLPSTLYEGRNVGCSLTSGPCTKQAPLSVRLASSARVKKASRGRMDDQDQARHLNRTVRTTCGLRWPESSGFLAAIFWRIIHSQQKKWAGGHIF